MPAREALRPRSKQALESRASWSSACADQLDAESGEIRRCVDRERAFRHDLPPELSFEQDPEVAVPRGPRHRGRRIGDVAQAQALQIVVDDRLNLAERTDPGALGEPLEQPMLL